MKTSLFKIERAERINQLYRDFDFRSAGLNDPIQLVRDYQKGADLELAAFLSSTLAFGRIELFTPVIKKILDMGRGDLRQFVLGFSPRRDGKLFDRLYYRIWTGRDLACLLFALRQVLLRYGSLENLFLKQDPGGEALDDAMAGFSEEFVRFDPAPVYGSGQFPKSFLVFVPSPKSGSACKRFALFLRWMIRKDDIDTGLWSRFSPARLTVPLDIHIQKMARFLKLTRMKTPGWKMAREVTLSLKAMAPEDPLKYDFPLCHFSIRNRCISTGGDRLCALCSIRGRCYFSQGTKRG